MKTFIPNLFLMLTCFGLLAMRASAQAFTSLHSFPAPDSESDTNADSDDGMNTSAIITPAAGSDFIRLANIKSFTLSPAAVTAGKTMK